MEIPSPTAATDAPTSPARRTMIIAAAAAALVAILIGLVIGPEHQRVGGERSGDAALAARVTDPVGNRGGLRSLAVAEITADTITWAGLGNAESGRRPGSAPTGDTPYELGSITKTFTAALFAEAIERGQVRADDQLAEHVPELAGTPAGTVTLAALAQHRSGLPGLGATAQAELVGSLLNENPYATTTTAQLIIDAQVAIVTPDQPPTYSNFGISLLGTALVRATGASDYPALVAERITGPLGMTHTTFAATDADVPAGAIQGFLFNGTPAPRWVGQGYLPSGTSTFTTVNDIARWAQALINGDAPGAKALDPTADFSGGARIGWVWLTTEVSTADGSAPRTMVWHNGATAGFHTMLALDRETGRAAVVLGNSAGPVEDIASSLLHGASDPGQPIIDIVSTWVTYGFALILAVVALITAYRRRALLTMINWILAATFGAVLLWNSGPWSTVGGWAYGLALAPTLAAITITAVRARTVAFLPPRRVWLSCVGVAISALLIIGATQLW